MTSLSHQHWTLNQAEEKLASLNITTTLEDTNLNRYSVNYAQEKNAREDRLIAYANMEKLPSILQ